MLFMVIEIASGGIFTGHATYNPYGDWGSERIVSLILTFILMVLSGGGLFLLFAWTYRCKKCKKWWALIKGSTDYAGEQKARFQVETGVTRSEYDGKVTQRHYSDADHTRAVYRITYSCKYCENKEYDSKYSKYRKV
jgi:hypothetical protein